MELKILSLPDYRWFHNSATRFFPPSENSWPGEQDSVPPHKRKLCSAVTCHQRAVQAQQFCRDRVVWMQQGCTTQDCWTASIPLDGRESAATAGWFGNVDLIIPSHKRTGAFRGVCCQMPLHCFHSSQVDTVCCILSIWRFPPSASIASPALDGQLLWYCRATLLIYRNKQLKVLAWALPP